jgi:hypothetical protein
MIKNKEIEYIGQFDVKSGVLRVSDPCYSKDTWCAGVIEDVKNGVWDAYIKKIDNRVGELIIYYSKSTQNDIKNANWIEQSIDVGVDSGQCGIFDNSLYPDNKTGEYGDEDTFYGKCCELTNPCGTLDFGVVSSSGYGDGSYTCYTIENEKGVFGVKIIFLEDYDDYDDDIFDDDDNDDDDHEY